MGHGITIESRMQRSESSHSAKTVGAAFRWFLSKVVNLDSKITTTARASRSWLFDQIHKLPEKHDDFPLLYPEIDIPFGSFARRTRIRELDDIDLIVGVSAVGSTYQESGETISISVPDATRLRHLCFEESNQLNSRRVINLFVKHLSDIPQYSKGEVGRNGEAAVLDLVSYPWSFDIVPGFFTTPELDGRTYYIIPDVNGQWKKTDPRKDRDRVREINQAHEGRVLNVVRLVKYWNRRATMPSASSYVLESIVLNYYESSGLASEWIDLEISPVLHHIALAILSSVQDPKLIQGNINDLSWAERVKISDRATADAQKATRASDAENNGDHKEAIRLWGEIFGPAFPIYG